MVCKSVLEEPGKAGARDVILGCARTIEQSSVEVQYKEKALRRGKKVGDGMGIIKVGRRRDWSRKVNQVFLAISHGRRAFARRGRGRSSLEISNFQGMG